MAKANRRSVPWIKDARGFHVEPGCVIAAGVTGQTLLPFVVVEGIYLDKANGEPYGTRMYGADSVLFKHLDDEYYSVSNGLIESPIVSIKGKIIRPNKEVHGTKTFAVSTLTKFGEYHELSNFIRVAETLDEFLESPIFL